MRHAIAFLALALLASACAPRLQTVGPPVAAPALDGAALIATDGARLPLRRWLPDGAPEAVVVALHGFNDYSNAFADTGATLAARGVALYAYDQRGFGATARPGLWAGTEAMVADLAAMTALARGRHPGAPLYLLGDSMGGAVVMTALARGAAGPVAGAVLVAPAVWGRETMNPFYRVALWLGAHTVPWLALTGRGLDITPSDNTQMLIALGRDPLVIKETRVDAIHGLVDLMDAALDAAPAIATPLLVLYGAHDEIIPKAPTALMLDRLAGPRAVAVYPDGDHMLMRDLQANVVHDDLAAWIAAPGAALPSGHDTGWRRFLDE